VYSSLLKTTIATLLTCTVLVSTPVIALELNLNLEDNSALSRLTDTDWALLKSTAKDALNNSEDGNSHVWKNPETSNAGVSPYYLQMKVTVYFVETLDLLILQKI